MENLSETPHLPSIKVEKETFLVSFVSRLYEDHIQAASLIYEFKEKVREIIQKEEALNAMLITIRFLKELAIYTNEELETIIAPFVEKQESQKQSLHFITQGVLQDLYNQYGGDIEHLEENIAIYNKIIEESLPKNEPAKVMQESEAINSAISDTLQSDRENE